MTERDQYDEQAERLLPCLCQSVRGPKHNVDNTYCPAYRRPAVAAALRALGQENERLRAERRLSVDREWLGKLVRLAWVKWAKEQPDAKPSWLVPWEELEERYREVDRRIGEFIASQCVTPDLLKVEAERDQLRVDLAQEQAVRKAAEAGNQTMCDLYHERGQKLDAAMSQLAQARAEVRRLKAGKFTKEEFNDLCHEEKPMSAEEFTRGCMLYQKKLFGFSKIESLVNENNAGSKLNAALAENNYYLVSKLGDIDLKYRRMLWLNHGHQGLYGDDGEMQCAQCRPHWDYKRMPLEQLEAQVHKLKMVEIAKAYKEQQEGKS